MMQVRMMSGYSVRTGRGGSKFKLLLRVVLNPSQQTRPRNTSAAFGTVNAVTNLKPTVLKPTVCAQGSLWALYVTLKITLVRVNTAHVSTSTYFTIGICFCG